VSSKGTPSFAPSLISWVLVRLLKGAWMVMSSQVPSCAAFSKAS